MDSYGRKERVLIQAGHMIADEYREGVRYTGRAWVLRQGGNGSLYTEGTGSYTGRERALTFSALMLLITVERIQCGLMKLVHLEEMNGAVLYVDRDEMNFYKMENIKLGENWPLQD
ncbi:hypothetical protein ElyMa_004079700 [Elysia marginata]|uniref:Uncharacterized protein n=1 Tax=Elysia marginata TaxID=1093978 RepID=A0AAV4G9T5_9GAST|nr:hypothetical protein ElyMa_004079700 [Elysia marginata]